MTKRSAGILMYRGSGPARELLLVHPGGPFWAKKDDGAWSIPKGEYDEARTRSPSPSANSRGARSASAATGDVLESRRDRAAEPQVITAFAIEGDFDPATLTSNHFEMEWPPNSGQMQSFPEVDRAAVVHADEAARQKILPGQAPFIDRLLERLPGGAVA